jgi:hypothetical protein
MRRAALLLPFVAACASTPEAGEQRAHTRSSNHSFTSAESVLLDFELDGTVVTDTNSDAELRTQIEAQLMYTVGQLNVVRSVGRHERLDLSKISTTPDPVTPGRFVVSYHAKLPVAWGQTTYPSAYSLTLPARIPAADQAEFAAKYGTTCVDPTAGVVDTHRMFLFFRPQNAGCAIAENDAVTVAVSVSPSTENTDGKYPEYHRVWDDGILEVVAMFTRSLPAPSPDDEGVRAYDEFVGRTAAYLRALQPNAAKRTAPDGLTPNPGEAVPRVEHGATLPDGRRILIRAALVGYHLADDGAAFDAWYDARTPTADMILYNGHAGLGENVRTLMTKGSFRAGQYVIWMLNGCDTFAYVDRTLAARRALVNSDDPTGTKYMDTVSNVLSGYFATTAASSMSFLTAIADGRDPKLAKSYQQIFKSIDPEQVVVVTGEDDNTFDPATTPIAPAPTPVSTPGSEDTTSPPTSEKPGPGEEPDGDPAAEAAASRRSKACSIGSSKSEDVSFLIPLLGLAALVSRRRLRTAP